MVGHQLSRQAYHNPAGPPGRLRLTMGWIPYRTDPAAPVALDPREFAGGRWWAGSQIESTSPARFDPSRGRFLAKIRSTLG